MAATAHKGLMELEATPAPNMDMSVPSEAAFSGVMSDSSASVKVQTRFRGLLIGCAAPCTMTLPSSGCWGHGEACIKPLSCLQQQVEWGASVGAAPLLKQNCVIPSTV